MKVYKMEVLVIDHEGMSEDNVIFYLEDASYISPRVMSVESRDIGEWRDDHPLNYKDTIKQEYERLFGEPD